MSLLPSLSRPQRLRPRSLALFALKPVGLPLARTWRRRLGRGGTVFVGVTGSAGKTTTKRLLAAVLAVDGPVSIRRGSGNRARSLARTLLSTRPHDRYCVAELAAYAPGSLRELLWALEPDVAVVTNAGWDHYKLLRGPDGVAAEKSALVAAVPPSGLAVLNADDERVRGMAGVARGRVVTYGCSDGADVRAEDVRSPWPEPLSFTLVHEGRRLPVRTRLHGTLWTTAALAALATGIALGIEPERAAAALAAAEPEPHRLSPLTTPAGVTFLLDGWKASAWTVPHSLEVLGSASAKRRIVVIGQLADDPRAPRRLYADAARAARERAELVVLVGRWAHHGRRGVADDDDSIRAFETSREASAFLEETLTEGDLVLLKGTHAQDHMERLAYAHLVDVRCWLDACGRKTFCEHCRRLTGGPRDRLPGPGS